MTDPIHDSAEDIIAAFGGIRPMAKKLGVAVTTIQGWKARGSIPLARLEEIRAAAAREDIDLSGGTPDQMHQDQTPESQTPEGQTPGDRGDRIEEVEAEPVRPKPDAGVRASGSGPKSPPVIDQTSRRPRDPNRQRQILVLAACVVGAALLGAILTYIWVGAPPAGDSGALAGRIEKLERRVDVAERAAREATAKAAAADASTRELSRLARALGGLEARLAALAQQVKSAGDPKSLKAELARVDAAEKSLTRLAQEVAAVTRKAAATAAATGDPKAIARLIAQTETLQKALAAQTTDLKAATAKLAASTDKAMAALRQRVTRLESRTRALAENASRTSSLLLALGQLRQAASGGRPFRAALESAAGLATKEAAIKATLQRLDTFANKGVPSLRALRERFDPLTARLLRAAAVPSDGDWMDRMWARISSLVVVRRTGRQVAGDTLPALVARAEVALRDGKLADAVALVGQMPPVAQKSAAAWLKDARARLVVDTALNELARLAVRLVAGRGRQAPGAAE